MYNEIDTLSAQVVLMKNGTEIKEWTKCELMNHLKTVKSHMEEVPNVVEDRLK